MTKVIRLNGESYSTAAPSISELLGELELASINVAVEYNREILQKSFYQSTNLVDGDEIEIVHCVAGG